MGRIGKVTSEAALAVEVDHSTAKGAVVYPVPMVGAGHSSVPARRISALQAVREVGRSGRAVGRRLRVRLSDDDAGALDMSAPMVG